MARSPGVELAGYLGAAVGRRSNATASCLVATTP